MWRLCPISYFPHPFREILQHEVERDYQRRVSWGGVYICFRTDCSLINLRWLGPTQRLETSSNRRVGLCRRRTALVAHTHSASQRITTSFAEASHFFDLEVSLKKTEVLYQPAARERDHFHYLFLLARQSWNLPSSLHTWAASSQMMSKIDKEVDNRLAKANSAFEEPY